MIKPDLMVSMATFAFSVGCNPLAIVEPIAEIKVTRSETGYDLLFTNCGHRWFADEAVSFSDLIVLRGAGRADGLPTQCELSKTSPAIARLSGHWVYGTRPDGYVLSPCEPLERGATYQVQLQSVPHGRRAFSINSDGSVVLGESACR